MYFQLYAVYFAIHRRGRRKKIKKEEGNASYLNVCLCVFLFCFFFFLSRPQKNKNQNKFFKFKVKCCLVAARLLIFLSLTCRNIFPLICSFVPYEQRRKIMYGNRVALMFGSHLTSEECRNTPLTKFYLPWLHSCSNYGCKQLEKLLRSRLPEL